MCVQHKLGRFTPSGEVFSFVYIFNYVLNSAFEQLAKLVEMSDTDKVSKNDAKTIFRQMAEQGGDPEEIAKASGFLITNDTGRVLEVIEKVIAANEKAVNQYVGGDVKVFGFLMGQCSKELKGVCTPKVIKEELEKKLKSL